MTELDINAALDRIARTADGEALYLWLQLQLQALAPPGEAGALYRHEGRRSFAADLIGHMAQGIADSGGRHDPSDIRQRPIVVAARSAGGGERKPSVRDWRRALEQQQPADTDPTRG